MIGTSIFKSGSHDPDHAHLGTVYHPEAIIYLRTKFENCSFNVSKDMMGPQNLKMGHVTMTTPIWG